jgi:hypothetical protein
MSKTADLIKEHSPAITFMQGIEHTVKTILGGWIGLCPFKDLCQFTKFVSTYIS